MKSSTSSPPREQQSEFPWFGLPAQAKQSRVWALAGLILTGLFLSTRFVVNEFSAARCVTMFDPAQLQWKLRKPSFGDLM